MAEQNFKELPKMHTTYANVIKSLIPHGDNRAGALPDSVYAVDKLAIDQNNLRDYRRICGFIDDGRVPPTYFAVLSQTLQMNMMAKPDFPFAMLGLVHLENSVTQYRPIFDTETVKMSVRLDNLTPHDKGQTFDFITEVHIDDELVWQGTSTYLSRQKKPVDERTVKSVPESVARLEPDENGWAELINIPEDIGRRYAFVSGDFNLIHLHPLSARRSAFLRQSLMACGQRRRALLNFMICQRRTEWTCHLKRPFSCRPRLTLWHAKRAMGEPLPCMRQGRKNRIYSAKLRFYDE